MITAYASGKAANNPPPPSTSQVSLPSHTGAIEFMAVSRSRPTGSRENSTPMPRSNPSMTTYMNTAKARMRAPDVGERQVFSHDPAPLRRP